jgi:hypothetical protein
MIPVIAIEMAFLFFIFIPFTRVDRSPSSILLLFENAQKNPKYRCLWIFPENREYCSYNRCALI